MIPEAAVEAAAEMLEMFFDFTPELARRLARTQLEAAAPHMTINTHDGEGDYLPGWDDRKTLAHTWQQHAPLPAEGLSDAVYEALIAVATWGYQQRKDEAL